jgi:hypothetical protein
VTLVKTKQILKRLRDRWGEYLREAKKDIRPDYTGQLAMTSNSYGYSYNGIDNYDRDFIYNSIGELGIIVNDSEGAIHFDVDNVFITEAKAVEELKAVKSHIENKLTKLSEIKLKYSTKEHSTYPIEVCLQTYTSINDILNEIFESDEFKEFQKPGTISNLTNQNTELQFSIYWSKRKWNYIIHLLAFIPFIIGAVYLLLHKDDKEIIGLSKSSLLVLSGLLTIIFNILFNNHNSFKDSFKLILKKSRDKLIAKEKETFIKSNKP